MDPMALLLAALDAAERQDWDTLRAVRDMAAEASPGVPGLGDPDGASARRVAGHNAAFVRLRLANVGEACVPNKDGKGHHDDETGYPCTGSGNDEPGDKGKGGNDGASTLRRAASAGIDFFKKVGHKAAHYEHVAKVFVTEKIPAALERIKNDKVRAVAKGLWFTTKLGTKAAFATYLAGQNLASEVAKQAGANEAQTARLAGICTALDLAGAKAIPLTLSAIGLPALGFAGSFVPLGSAAYLCYSTARRPLAVLRAAHKTVREALSKKQASEWLVLEAKGDARATVEAILAGLEKAHDPDAYMATLLMAMAEAGSVEEAIRVADGLGGKLEGGSASDDDGGDEPPAPPVPEGLFPLMNEGYTPSYDHDAEQWLIGDTSLDRHRSEAQEAGFSGEKKDSRGRRRCYSDGKLVPCEGNEAGAQKRRAKKDQALADRMSKPPETTVLAWSEDGQTRVKSALRDILPGGEHNVDGVAKLVGAQHGAEVGVYPSHDGISVSVDHPAIKDQRRTLLVKEGKLVCKNEMFFLKKKHRGGGFGMKVFTDQVQALMDIGADHIETCAGRGGIMNGYYTWARMGYDAPLEPSFKRALYEKALRLFKKQGHTEDEAGVLAMKVAEPGGRPPETVQDLMATEAGRAYWKAKGYMTTMRFDLKPGSRSLEVHNAYRATKGLAPLAPADAEKAEVMREARTKFKPPPPPPPPPPSPEMQAVVDRADAIAGHLAHNRERLAAMGFLDTNFLGAFHRAEQVRRAAGMGTTTAGQIASIAVAAMDELRTRHQERQQADDDDDIVLPPVEEGLREGCVPNQTGKGHHDDRTGHPCSPSGGKPTPSHPPGKAHPHTGSPAARPVSSKVRQKRKAIRHAEAQRVDGPVQLVGYHTTNHLAEALGGDAIPGSKPQDIEVLIDGQLHGIECKAFVTTRKRPPAVKMGRLTRLQKEDWEAEHDAVMHTVMVDHRERWAKHGEHTSHRLTAGDMFPCFYRRGGSNGVATEPPAILVKSPKELLSIMALSDDELEAKYKGNGNRPLRLLGSPEEDAIRARVSKR